MIKFINEHRKVFGVEPICKVLPIAPSIYYPHAARQTDPSKRPERAKLDGDMMIKIQRVFDENHQVYGVRKIWAQLKREGIVVARCTVARLMKFMGLKGAVRGKSIKQRLATKTLRVRLIRSIVILKPIDPISCGWLKRSSAQPIYLRGHLVRLCLCRFCD